MSLAAGNILDREDAIRNNLVKDVSHFARTCGIPLETAFSKSAFNKLKATRFEEKNQIDNLKRRIVDTLSLYKKWYKLEKKPVLDFHVPLFRWSDDLLVECFQGIIHKNKDRILLTIVLPGEVEINFEPHIQTQDGKIRPLITKI